MPKTLSELRWYKVLDTLYRNPESTLNINEIARKADISPSTAFDLLKLAEKDGVVTKKRSTKQHNYKINFSSPLARKTCELIELQRVTNFSKKNKDYEIIFRDIKEEIIKTLKDGLLVLIVFGSIPKGYYTKKSDIDILLIVQKKAKNYLIWKRGIDDVAQKIHAWHGRNTSPVFMTLEEFREKLKGKDPFIFGIVKDHFILYGSETYIREVFDWMKERL